MCYVLKDSAFIDVTDYSLLLQGEKFIVPEMNKTVSMELTSKSITQKRLIIVLVGQFSKDIAGKELFPYRQTFCYSLLELYIVNAFFFQILFQIVIVKLF